jgi:hypothetical protein
VKRDTTKLAGDVADAKLFDDWFDLIETDLRTKMPASSRRRWRGRSIDSETIPARILGIAQALDLDPFARFEIVGQ